MMISSLWIAFGFTAFLVIILTIAIFIPDKLSDNQVNILRFLTSLCAGFAAGFFTGDALFKLDTTMSSAIKFTVSGSTGCALFFTVWFTYKKVLLRDGFNFTIGANYTFHQAVDCIMQIETGAVQQYNNFTQAELDTVLRSKELHTTSALDALRKLKHLGSVPDYTVSVSNNVYLITKI